MAHAGSEERSHIFHDDMRAVHRAPTTLAAVLPHDRMDAMCRVARGMTRMRESRTRERGDAYHD